MNFFHDEEKVLEVAIQVATVGKRNH